jgi:hypothetical protein
MQPDREEATGVPGGWLALVARERERGFASLAGTRAEIAVPVCQPLVDRLLARVLAGRPATAVQVDLLEGARVGVAVSHRVFGLPVRARTVLELDRQVDLARGRVVLRHDDGALWTTIRSVAGTLGLLPPGVSFGPGTVEVDLAAMAARAGIADLLPLVESLAIHGPADGLFAIEADVAVPEGGVGAGAGDTPAGRPAGPAPGRDPETSQWLADLAGLRARVNLWVHESLANEALTLARTFPPATGSPRTAAPSSGWTSFVHEARIGFHERRLELTLDLEVPSPE